MKIPKPYWPDNAYYFITTTTFLHFPYFRSNEQKQVVLDRLKGIENELNLEIKAFSIAMNHFHYLIFLEKGELYSKIKQFMNGGISFQYGKRFSKKYKEMWQSTKAVIINSEKSYWIIMGYIIGNLLKHKEVNTFYELNDHKFSSYSDFVNKFGKEMARQLVYRVIDVDEGKKCNVDLEHFKNIDVRGILKKGLKPKDPG